MMRDSGFVTSSFCNLANCVAVRSLDGQILVTRAAPHEGAVLSFTREEWEAFLAGVRNGEFDFK